MKLSATGPVLALVSCFALAPVPGVAADLLEVYRLAQQRDPLLGEAEANRMAAQEARPQARSALLPQVSLSATETDQGRDGLSSQFSEAGFVNTLFDSDSNQTFFGLRVNQSLFHWDQWIAMRQADKIVTQADVDYEIAAQELMLRVSERYFDVLAAADELEAAEANKRAIARQLEQSETRFEVGLIAITDVEESRAGYDLAVATEIQAKRVLATARENLREVIGTYVEDLEAPGDNIPLEPPDPADADAWVDRALDQNLRLVSSRLGVEIAKDTIDSRRAGHLPTLDLVVRRDEFESDTSQTLTFPDSSDPGPFDSPTRSDTSTDIIELQFNLPLYGGGFVSSRVREAVYEHRAARQRLERVARETERQTRDAFLGVLSEASRVRALQKALESTQTALRATEAGFDVGTRTTVDVLDVRRDLFRARTDLARSRYDYVVNLLRLQQAAGTISEEDIAEVNAWLN